jgi:hypothetical protein
MSRRADQIPHRSETTLSANRRHDHAGRYDNVGGDYYIAAGTILAALFVAERLSKEPAHFLDGVPCHGIVVFQSMPARIYTRS